MKNKQINKVRLLNQAYNTLCEKGEGWTLEMLANMKNLVTEAEEEYIKITFNTNKKKTTDG